MPHGGTAARRSPWRTCAGAHEHPCQELQPVETHTAAEEKSEEKGDAVSLTATPSFAACFASERLGLTFGDNNRGRTSAGS